MGRENYRAAAAVVCHLGAVGRLRKETLHVVRLVVQLRPRRCHPSIERVLCNDHPEKKRLVISSIEKRLVIAMYSPKEPQKSTKRLMMMDHLVRREQTIGRRSVLLLFVLLLRDKETEQLCGYQQRKLSKAARTRCGCGLRRRVGHRRLLPDVWLVSGRWLHLLFDAVDPARAHHHNAISLYAM